MKKLWSEVEQEFFDNLDVKVRSKNTYRRQLNVFKVWIITTGRNINSLKRSDILAYKSHLISQGKEAATIDTYLTILRLFYQFIEEYG